MPTEFIIVHDGQVLDGWPKRNYQRVADIWSVLLNMEITATQVALCMIGMKMVPLAESPNMDFLREIAVCAAAAIELEYGGDDENGRALCRLSL